MTDLDICDMKFDNSEIGDMIKSFFSNGWPLLYCNSNISGRI